MNIKRISGLLLALAALTGLTSAYAFPTGTVWDWANPKPSGNPMQSIAYNGSTFIAVGANQSIRRSSDGFNWTNEIPLGSGIARKIIWSTGQSQFVFVGDAGRISTSGDGNSWFVRTSGTSANLNDVTDNGSLLVAVGDNATVLTSTDASSWTVGSAPASSGNLQAITWNGSFFVTVSSNGKIFTSPDAISWAEEPTPATLQLRDIVWDGSLFVAVGSPAVIYTSPDGVNWTQRSAPSGIIEINSVIWDGSQFIAVGKDGYIIKSSDGINWLQVAKLSGVGYQGSFFDVISLPTAITSGKYFVVGSGGNLISSLDLGQWNVRQPNPTLGAGRFDSVVYNGSQFVAVGLLASVVSSADGLSWTQVSTNTYSAITWDGSKFIAVGSGSTAATSTTGSAWTSHPLPGSYVLSGVGLAHDGSLLAVGANGTLLTSSDGNSWLAQTSGTAWFYGIAASSTRTVVVGVGKILSSTDLLSWTVESASGLAARSLTDVVFANGKFVAVGPQGALYTSPDGVSWSDASLATSNNLRSIDWDGNQFIAAGDAGEVMTSPDGVIWTEQKSRTVNGFMDIAGDSSTQVAVGWQGTIMVSQALNEAPVPTASALIVNEDASGNLQVQANDPDLGDSWSYAVTSGPTNGSASIAANGLTSYTPTANFNGSDNYTVTVTDAGGLSATVDIAVTVTAINDAPVPSASPLIVNEDTLGNLQVQANDPDLGDSWSYAVTSGPTNGSASIAASGLTSYTPAANFNGSDSYTVTVTDAGGLSASVNIAVTVTAVNDAPIASAPAMTLAAGGSGSSQIIVNDVDSGDTHSFSISLSGIHGSSTVSATGLVNYTVDSGYSGTDALQITVTDSAGASTMVAIGITVTAASSSGGGGGGGGSSSMAWFLLLAAASLVRVKKTY